MNMVAYIYYSNTQDLQPKRGLQNRTHSRRPNRLEQVVEVDNTIQLTPFAIKVFYLLGKIGKFNCTTERITVYFDIFHTA